MLDLQPRDVFNNQLLNNVHPEGWLNPEPAPEYHLVVVGGGPAGLISAAGAAGLGAKVALVERNFLGGDCLNVGCVPSKALLSCARRAHQVRAAGEYGIRIDGPVRVDFPAVMERLRRIRAEISRNDSAQRYRDELGVDVFLGEPKFTGSQSLDIGGKRLKFRKAVITTGARAVDAKIPGLSAAEVLTNENLFNLTELPPRLGIIGGGVIGCEMAQAFSRLGSQVTILQNEPRLLPREDADAAAILSETFRLDGISVITETAIQRVETRSGGGYDIHMRVAGQDRVVPVDRILMAAGRAPNVQELNLEAAGIQYDERRGIQIDDHFRTTNPKIFAAGDVAMAWKFTHAADAAARMVIHNALFMGRQRLSSLVMPWCTFTDPEIARVGANEDEARQKGLAVDVYRHAFAETDRGAAEGARDGFVKILTVSGKDRIVGALAIGEDAGEMLNEVTSAMVHGIGLRGLGKVIHPYPTRAETIKRAADACNRARLTPWTRWFLKKTLQILS